MTRFLGLAWAPLSIPLSRRLQTLAVLYYTLDFINCLGLLYIAILVGLLLTPLFFVTILYAIWYVYDFHTPSRGGYSWRPLHKWFVYELCRDYFPIKLVKTADIDPSKNYIFGVHPHGVLSNGIICNFASDATGFDRLFPGIRRSILTLKENFFFPIHREIMMLTGVCNVTRESIDDLLTQHGTGQAVVIVPGGAIEATNAAERTMVLTLAKRMGFVRMAMIHGADLVPVIQFGENDIYKTMVFPRGSLLKKLQEKFTKTFGPSPPVYYGRGIFQYTFGPLPFRKPITGVVGRPISVTRNPEATREQVAELHAKYCDELVKLFNEHKSKYGYEDVEIVIN